MLDKTLIEQCLAGNEAAWYELIRKHERLILSIARAGCGDPHVAEDIFQQVCMDLYKRLDELRVVSSLPGWLVTVTRRRCVDYFRSKKPTDPFDEAQHDIADHSSDRILLKHAVEQALETLHPTCRALLKLLYHDQLSYAEIARKLDMPVSSIGPTRIRCLKKLRNALETYVDPD